MNRMYKRVVKTSVFPADRESIWERLQYLQTLQHIAYPYATFEPIGQEKAFVWKEGEVFRFRFKLFGITGFI